MDLETLRLVTLRQRLQDLSEEDEDYGEQEWVVKDLLTEGIWTSDQNSLGRDIYTEMSALAYVADRPEIY